MDGVRKAYLELNLMREVKGNKNNFSRYISRKRKTRENMGLVLNGTGDLVTKCNGKGQISRRLLPTVIVILGFRNRSVKEDQIRKHLSKLDAFKSVRPDVMHSGVLWVPADIIVKPLQIIFERS